jgi:hypothetical protein
VRRHSVHNAHPWRVLGCIRGKRHGVVAYPPGCPLNQLLAKSNRQLKPAPAMLEKVLRSPSFMVRGRLA